VKVDADEVENDDIIRGYEVERGKHVVETRLRLS
jgi:hypothetical protein